MLSQWYRRVILVGTEDKRIGGDKNRVNDVVENPTLNEPENGEPDTVTRSEKSRASPWPPARSQTFGGGSATRRMLVHGGREFSRGWCWPAPSQYKSCQQCAARICDARVEG